MQAERTLELLKDGRYCDHDVTIALTDNRHMTVLNARYALKRTPTDVLSFRLADNGKQNRSYGHKKPNLTFEEELNALRNAPYLDPTTGQLISSQELDQRLIPPIPKDLGTVFLSVEYCCRIAKKRGMLRHDYLLLATVHGLAHLVGYVHKTGATYAEMKRAEESVMGVLRHGLMSDENAKLTDCISESTGKRYIPHSYLE